MSRFRNWCFTLNNYTEEDVSFIREIQCRYLVFGKEVGESGTPHLQGYVIFDDAKTMSAAKKCLGTDRVAVFAAKGTFKQASDYCKKDDPEYFEKGILPIGALGKKCSQEERIAYNKRLREASLDELVKSGDISIKEVRSLKNARMDLAEELGKKSAVTMPSIGKCFMWYHGPSGTGKSRKAREENPGAYLKQPNKWWNNYNNEDVVIIEEWSPCHHVLANYLKQWADHYPFPAEVKGGQLFIRPKKIIITSNYSIEECFSESADYEPLMRRFTSVKFSKCSSPSTCILEPQQSGDKHCRSKIVKRSSHRGGYMKDGVMCVSPRVSGIPKLCVEHGKLDTQDANRVKDYGEE